MSKADVHTLPHKGGWANKIEGSSRVANTAAKKVERGGAAERGAIVACSNVIRLSIAGALFRVSAWAAELAGTTEAPEGPVEWPCCAGGILAAAPAGGAVLPRPERRCRCAPAR